MTVREAVDDHPTYPRTEDRARKTVVKNRGEFDLFIGYLGRHRVARLGQVTAGRFDRYQAERKATRHRKTVNCEGVILKQPSKWAKGRKLIADNPPVEVRLDKPPLQPKEGPSLAQEDAILMAADEPLRGRLAVLAFTGMRAGGPQRLRPEDVDPAGGWGHIRSRLAAETKTRVSRKVPVHPHLRAVLERLPRTRRPWLFTAAPIKKFPAGDHHISTKRPNKQFTRLAGSRCRSAGTTGSWYTTCGISLRRSRRTPAPRG